jgi:uncharacterized membrane protein
MVNSNLATQIQVSIAQGKSPEEIYLELLRQKHTVKEIQEGFEAAQALEHGPETQKRTVGLILAIGAVLVGAGIFSFIAANWQEMSRSAKVAVIIVSMLVVYGIGWLLRERLKFVRTGNALILLGSIIYGAGIFLIGQIFHIRSNWPDGFILWMLGVLPMAFAVKFRALFALALVVGLIGLGAHPFGIFDAMEYNPFLLSSSFLLLAAAAASLCAGLFIRKRMSAELEGKES